MERSSDMAATAQVVLAVLGVLAAVHLMKVILVPVALALLLACLLAPITRGLRRVLPLSATGASVVLFVLLTVVCLFVALMAAAGLNEVAISLPSDAERLAGTVSRGIEELIRDRPYLRGFVPNPGTIDRLGDQNRTELMTILQERLTDVGEWVGQGLMILVLVLFILAESETLTPRVIRFFTPAPGDARAAQRALEVIIRKIRSYLVTRTLLNAGLGVAVVVVLKLFGVGFATPLGVFTALASFIPYIGQVIAGIVILLVSLAQSGSVGDTLIVASVYAALVGVEGYLIMPYVMGRSLDLNGTTVLLACLLWGFLWGLVGLFLAIPITVSIKLVFQHIPRLHRWAELMSQDWQTPLPSAEVRGSIGLPSAAIEAEPAASSAPSRLEMGDEPPSHAAWSAATLPGG